MIASGKLEQRVTILEPSATSLVGETATTYTEAKSVWSEVLPLNARKIALFRQSDFKATHSVRFRHASYPELTPQHRICWHGVAYAIETMINEDNKDETWALTVVSVAGRE